MTFWDKIKQKIWRGIYNVFPKLEHFFVFLHKKERQKYHLGWVRAGVTLVELKRHLHSKWGFGNHFVAWEDPDQVLSWRKLESFKEQYHLRVYSDGEIRGHFEFTPEAHPFDHFGEKGETEHKKAFEKFLGDFMVQQKHISHLKMDPDAWNPDSEITISSSKTA